MDILSAALPAEIIAEIVDRAIVDGASFKAIRLVSRGWRDMATQLRPTGDVDYANHLATLIKLFPDREWDWHDVAANPSTPMDVVERLAQEGFTGLYWPTARPLDLDMLARYPDTFVGIADNDHITSEFVLAHPEVPWDIEDLMSNEHVDIRAMIAAGAYTVDNICYISNNNKLDIELILQYNESPGWDNCWDAISESQAITPEDVIANDLPWDWDALSSNPSMIPMFLADWGKNGLVALQYPWTIWRVIDQPAIAESLVNMSLTPILMTPDALQSYGDARLIDEYVKKYGAGVLDPLPTGYTAFSYARNLTGEIIEANVDLAWEWSVCLNYCSPEFAFDPANSHLFDVSEDYDLPTKISWKTVVARPDHPWYFQQFSAYDNRGMVRHT